MKTNKEIRRLSRAMLRASFTDGQLDRGKVASIVQSLIEKKPRHCIDILQNYKRLLRLEIEKRHATIESAAELSPEVREQIVSNLKRKYGTDLTIKFVVNPQLIGGMRVRLGSNVWDGSVQNRLQRLAQQI
ncbi:MAG TPA: ATP synthase F1 subunit delta [Chthoniobacterales bacterium]|jgi:F-type H+-transporting ATPase subunit delta|nr:ATP synthase F1 subunit delta [Chthoniobacterales bacterium]